MVCLRVISYIIALVEGSDLLNQSHRSHRCNYEDLVRDYVVSYHQSYRKSCCTKSMRVCQKKLIHT